MTKHLDLAGLTVYDGKIKEWFKSGIVDITDDAIRALFVTVAEGPADNEIWYTTNDGQKLVWAEIGAVPTTDIQMVGGNDDEYCVYYTPGDIGYERIYGYTVISHEYCEDLKCFVIKFDKPLTEVFWMSDSMLFSTGGGRFNITSIQLPKTILRIGDSAFYQQPLTSITIPSNTTYIGYTAFRYSDINSITYEGTKEQWYNALAEAGVSVLYISDDSDRDVIIHCIDGDIINGYT
jgi:hypothetical protein